MDGLIAYALSKKYADEVGRSIVDAGFKTQVERDRSILQTTGQEKILYFIPKTVASPSDRYDEYVYSNNAWEQVGATDVDLGSYATRSEVGDLNNLPTTDKSSIVSAISETFTSVSNGKSLVASAITDKGVSTSSDATFEAMAQNIEAIQTGSDFDMTVNDNQVKMVIEVNDRDLSFWTRFALRDGEHKALVDWGDGISDIIDENNYLANAPSKKHIYQQSGRYLITISAIGENTLLTIGSINYISTLSEGAINTDRNGHDALRILYNYKIKKLSFGKKIIAMGFEEIPLAEKIFSIQSSCYGTRASFISIRDDVTTIGNSWFMRVITPYIKIPASVQRIENEAFNACIIKIIDFTDINLNENNEFPIVFASNDIFNSTSASMILLFATQEIAEVAKTTTNLSQLASQIKYVGEV